MTFPCIQCVFQKIPQENIKLTNFCKNIKRKQKVSQCKTETNIFMYNNLPPFFIDKISFHYNDIYTIPASLRKN